MSHGIVPYVVNWDQLRKLWGSRDVPQLEHIKTVWKSQIAENADVYAHQIQNGAPSLGSALDDIFAGQIRKPGFASQYAYALEILCAQLGQKLPNANTAAIDDDWLRRIVDPMLHKWGLGTILSTAMLTRGSWPVAIPAPQGFPSGGSIGPDEVEHAVMVMRSAQPPRVDRDVIVVLGDLRNWLETAAGRRGGLVTFYY